MLKKITSLIFISAKEVKLTEVVINTNEITKIFEIDGITNIYFNDGSCIKTKEQLGPLSDRLNDRMNDDSVARLSKLHGQVDLFHDSIKEQKRDFQEYVVHMLDKLIKEVNDLLNKKTKAKKRKK